MEEKQVCVIAVMGNIWGEGEASWEKKGALRVNERRTRESGTERSRSKFGEIDAAKGYSKPNSQITQVRSCNKGQDDSEADPPFAKRIERTLIEWYYQ